MEQFNQHLIGIFRNGYLSHHRFDIQLHDCHNLHPYFHHPPLMTKDFHGAFYHAMLAKHRDAFSDFEYSLDWTGKEMKLSSLNQENN